MVHTKSLPCSKTLNHYKIKFEPCSHAMVILGKYISQDDSTQTLFLLVVQWKEE